ncbi:pyridoxal phosphate-dependent decarboxylase family protein [Brevibacterium aurantiacum]|uniref:pyridoxal phosphate-dependent decarboxylase family protein n=1 Tax=Brevibacterium aurantiacum TaxID=273384 RepID=UPI001868233F|nr:pyridoxal-dependent decarboxylase [Brevibacterium aurantiacum]
MTPEQFRSQGHALIDWIADYRSGLDSESVMSTVQPGDIAAMLSKHAPENGSSAPNLIGKLNEIVLPGITHWQHPRFFNFFPSNGELSSVLGDIASTGLGVIGLSWESSPALTEIEQQMMIWMRELFGLSNSWHGAIQDTASTSTFLALLEAREAASNFSMAAGGLNQSETPLVVYASEYAHSSVPKAIMLAGFGADNIRWVDSDNDFSMKPCALLRAVQQDKAAGKIPAAVVATCGTTTTTAVDPLNEIANIAESENMWFHVDAAMAGSAMVLPECRWMWEGVERADSLVVNAHKWLGVSFDCSLYFVKDPQHLERVMSTDPSYLQSVRDNEVTNLRDWGIPLGRRFRALKLWFMLETEGADSVRQRIRRDIDNAQWLAAQIEEIRDWRVVAPVNLQTVCIRHEPEGMTPDEIDAHTQKWARRLNESGIAYVSLSTLNQRWMVRISIGALGTERVHLQQAWEKMQEFADHQIK